MTSKDSGRGTESVGVSRVSIETSLEASSGEKAVEAGRWQRILSKIRKLLTKEKSRMEDDRSPDLAPLINSSAQLLRDVSMPCLEINGTTTTSSSICKKMLRSSSDKEISTTKFRTTPDNNNAKKA